MTAQQPLDGNYKPIQQNLYDPVGVQFISPQAGITKTGTDNTVYAPYVVTQVDGYKATFGASVTALASAASATDIFTIAGSATKTVHVTRLVVSGQQTTAASVQVVTLLRSAANTSGTSTTPTIVPYDSTNAAATAVVRAYTANPTTGTLVGNIRVDYLFLAAPATATVGSEKLVLDFGTRASQGIVLRGTAQVLAVNLNGVTVTGGAFDISIEFTEE